ncbi:hypothetical protein AX16_006858 [Volvariella volvacea WC 439]|nr:hypothetical protein AX16_006858 [Volvariella volvacea WC 439]
MSSTAPTPPTNSHKMPSQDQESGQAPIEDGTAQQHASVELRRRQNELAPIMRLPAELLERIMLDLRHRKSSSSTSWIQFTYVSHHWQTVAEFVDRSRDVPLIVLIRCDPGKPPGDAQLTLSVLMGAVDRIREFYYTQPEGFAHADWDQSFSSLDLSTSRLERLMVHGCANMYRNWKPTFSIRYLHLTNGSFNPMLITQDLQ